MTEQKNIRRSISPNIFILPIFSGVFVALLNIKWMQLFQLINAPQADSLVYITESFNDYWSLRNGDFTGLFKKYFLDGNQQTSPLLWWLAGLGYFLLGVDPVNAYLIIAIIYLIWIAGVIYLSWCIYPDSKYALACGLMAAFLPSVASNGLRNFMLDFVAAAPFIWATAYLIKSDLGFKRREVIIYAILSGITVLFRTTLLPYFLSHLIIVFLLAVSQKRHPNYRNITLAIIVGIFTCGWFIFPNLARIFEYYGYWASQAQANSAETSFFSNLGFYLNLIRVFHLQKSPFSATMILFVLASVSLIHISLKGRLKNKDRASIIKALIILLPLAFIPTLILSLYSSRAATVDYPYIAAYLLIPIFLWRIVTKSSKKFWIGAGMLIFILATTQAKHLVLSNSKDVRRIDFREREVIKMILDDATSDEKKNIVIGNTAIHQHNSLSYIYWILSNEFPLWQGHVTGVPIGRTSSANKLAKMNSFADYVITVNNFPDHGHPNNLVAPEANKVLQNQFNMDYLPQSFDIPNGSIVRILKNFNPNINFPNAESDGWHQNHVPIKLLNKKLKPITLQISGELFNGKPNAKVAVITLYEESNPNQKFIQSTKNPKFSLTFKLPLSIFKKNGSAKLILKSSWAGKPSQVYGSKDSRNLAFLKLNVQKNRKLLFDEVNF